MDFKHMLTCYGFYCKFPSLSSGEKNLKIGWDLTKLPPWV